jgi:hypothetical protein
VPEPRLLLDGHAVARLRAKLEHPRVAPSWERVRAEALRDAASPPPDVPDSGALEEWGVISSFVGRVSGEIERLAFAHLVEPGARHAAACVARVEALLAAPGWVDCCHAFAGRRFDLGVGHVCRALALTADWLGDAFPAHLRARAASILRSRAVEAFAADIAISSNWWLLHQINNWVPVMCAGLASVAVVFGESIGAWRGLLERAVHETGRYLRWVSRDGSVEEAGGYWAYGVMNALFVADIARRHCGEDWFGLPQLRRTGYFPLHGSVLGEYVLDFGDTTRGLLPAAPTLRLAAEYRDPTLQWYGELGSKADVLSLLWWDPELRPEPPPPALAPSTAYPGGVEWAILRSSLVDPDAVVVGLRGGTNLASHCHRDLNSIIVHAWGEPLIADHGNLGYSRDYWVSQYGHLGRDTRGHNTLLVDGMEQIQRRTIPTMAEGEDLRCRSRIAAFQTSDAADYAASEAVLTYGDGDGAGQGGRRVLVSHDRHLALIRPGLVLLVDDVSCPEPAVLSWLFHAGGDVEVTEPGGVFRRGETELDFTVHAPAGGELRLERRTDQKLPYLVVASAGPVTRATLVVTLLPCRAGSSRDRPEVTVRGRSIDLTWDGRGWCLDAAARRWRAGQAR